MATTLMIFHAVISILLILMVLLQFGKGAEAGLMGGSSGEVFTSSQQGNILSKLTVVLSALFLINSILLARIQGDSSNKSLLDTEAPVAAPLNSDPVPSKADAKPTNKETTPEAPVKK